MTHWLDQGALPEPWQDLRGHGHQDAIRRDALARELRREISAGHLLSGRGWQIAAQSAASDDILVRLDDGTAAVVHLTWTSTPPETPPWPGTRIVPSRSGLSGDCGNA